MNLVSHLQAKLRALSHRERLILLLCAGFLLVLAVIRFGAYPALQSFRKSRADIPQRRATLAHYRLAAQGEGKVDEAFADAGERLEQLEEGILPGDNPAAAGAALQGILKPWVERAGTRLTSMRTLAPVQKGEYSEVAVQLDLQTTSEGLVGILTEIPRHSKILKVKKVSVSSGFYGAASVNRREMLVVSIVIAGISDAAAPSRGEGAEE
ncbi:MAG: type II secretion system protein GspM [Deltaproteobacteria bacterium]|nr:type II secretion system protein GspM [Candidatus Deferrimicrobiaceae bacterium]